MKAIQKHIDRRALLKGAALTTAAGITAAAALRATIAQAAPVAVLAQSEPLVALWDAWRKADRRMNKAYARQDEAEGRARKAGFNIEVPIMTVGVQGCCSVPTAEAKRMVRSALADAERLANKSAA